MKQSATHTTLPNSVDDPATGVCPRCPVLRFRFRYQRFVSRRDFGVVELGKVPSKVNSEAHPTLPLSGLRSTANLAQLDSIISRLHPLNHGPDADDLRCG